MIGQSTSPVPGTPPSMLASLKSLGRSRQKFAGEMRVAAADQPAVDERERPLRPCPAAWRGTSAAASAGLLEFLPCMNVPNSS